MARSAEDGMYGTHASDHFDYQGFAKGPLSLDEIVSMLCAAVRQQAREIDRLRANVEHLDAALAQREAD